MQIRRANMHDEIVKYEEYRQLIIITTNHFFVPPLPLPILRPVRIDNVYRLVHYGRITTLITLRVRTVTRNIVGSFELHPGGRTPHPTQ